MEKKTVTQCYNEIVANEYGSDLKLKFKPATNGKFGSGKVDIIDTVNNLMMESNYSIQEDDMKQINLVKLHLKIKMTIRFTLYLGNKQCINTLPLE